MRWTYADACAKALGSLCFVVANMRVEASFTTGLVYFFFSTFNVFSQPGLYFAYRYWGMFSLPALWVYAASSRQASQLERRRSPM
jgi:hypothetical protein